MQPNLNNPSTSAQDIGLLQEHSLATLAQREVGRRIVSGEIGGGSKLNEANIAKALGISRGPVREAFRALDQAGLVQPQVSILLLTHFPPFRKPHEPDSHFV